MKVSYNLLQTFFEKPLPQVEAVVSLFEKHLAEVESTEEKNGDSVIDINILPDRAAYALSHMGIAYELSLLLQDNSLRRVVSSNTLSETGDFSVKLQSSLCDKYIALGIKNIPEDVETPEKIKKVLDALGQRSINFLVDIANFVMLEMGQPLHVFDKEKIEGGLVIRTANEGEKITTLDGREVTFQGSELVIADETAPLAIAGIKGGKKAEVKTGCREIVLEAAHFDASSVRKTSTLVQIKTDASKRFENKIDVAYAMRGALRFFELLKEVLPTTEISFFKEVGGGESKQSTVSFTLDFLQNKLGRDVTGESVKTILQKMSLQFKEENSTFTVTVPVERKDLCIPEDFTDEIGRLLGYDSLEAKLPEVTFKVESDKIFNLGAKARNFFMERGFSEVLTHALGEAGEFALKNPLASDKAFLRTNLTSAIKTKIAENLLNADLLGLSKIKIFEIGKVFRDGREFNTLAAGIGVKKTGKQNSPNEEIKTIRDEFVLFFGSKAQTLCTIDDTGGLIMLSNKQIGTINNEDGIFEIDFDAFTEQLENEVELLSYEKKNVKMSPISVYPFISRDVAFFVPAGSLLNPEEILRQKAGILLQRLDLFDRFEKKNKETGELEKVSFGYRLVFQSFERTLTEAEIEPIMQEVYDALKAEGLEVR